jgi:ribonuclease BN (tRNA processing enzyme)
MKVTVLGGSAAGGNTGAGCSGYLLDSGETRLVFDLGPGTLLELRRHCNYRDLNGIVISHMHLDHILDLCALRFALAYNPIAPLQAIPLRLPPGGIAVLDRIAAGFAEEGKSGSFFSDVFDVQEYDPAQSLAIGDVTIRFAATIHYIPCWAMRFSTSVERDLGYTADTGPAADLRSFFTGCQVVISEATLLETRDEPFASRGHLTATEAGQLATDVGAATLMLSHLWQELGFERLQRSAASAFQGRIVVATPGATIEW